MIRIKLYLAYKLVEQGFLCDAGGPYQLAKYCVYCRYYEGSTKVGCPVGFFRYHWKRLRRIR